MSANFVHNATCDPIAQAVAEERRKTVAFLRTLVADADLWFSAHPFGRSAENQARRDERESLARMIERGEHLR